MHDACTGGCWYVSCWGVETAVVVAIVSAVLVWLLFGQAGERSISRVSRENGLVASEKKSWENRLTQFLLHDVDAHLEAGLVRAALFLVRHSGHGANGL